MGQNGDVVNFVFGDNIELISEFSNNLRGCLESHCYLSAHSHSDLHQMINTGPISLIATFVNMLLGLLIVSL